MNLLDVATVIHEDVVRDSWNVTARECGVQMLISEACDTTPEEVSILGNDTTVPGDFKVVSFPIIGFFRRGQFCALPDDLDWFDAAFEANLDLVATWALTVEHAAGSTSWINATGVQSVAQAGAGAPTATDRVTAIAAGRRQWMKSVSTLDKNPILHVPPSLAPMLKVNGVLESDDKTIWGDRVVTGAGYDEHPNAFWSGPIVIHLGKRTSEQTPKVRTNDELTTGDQVMAIAVPPCTIVRVGAYV